VPTIATSYQARFDGDADAGIPSAVPSGVVRIVPKAYLSNPAAPSKMSRKRSYTVYGYLKPRHASGTYAVRVYKWRYSGGKWRSAGYAKAKVVNYSSYSKYSVSLKLTTKGKWRLAAYHADAGHAASWSSGYDYVTVK
jgi:hypothetical protein